MIWVSQFSFLVSAITGFQWTSDGRQLAIPKIRDFWSKLFKWNSFLKLYFLSVWWIILFIVFRCFSSWPPEVVNFAIYKCTWINFNSFFKRLNVAPHYIGNVRQNCDSPAKCFTLWDKFAIPLFGVTISFEALMENLFRYCLLFCSRPRKFVNWAIYKSAEKVFNIFFKHGMLNYKFSAMWDKIMILPEDV